MFTKLMNTLCPYHLFCRFRWMFSTQ